MVDMSLTRHPFLSWPIRFRSKHQQHKDNRYASEYTSTCTWQVLTGGSYIYECIVSTYFQCSLSYGVRAIDVGARVSEGCSCSPFSEHPIGLLPCNVSVCIVVCVQSS